MEVHHHSHKPKNWKEYNNRLLNLNYDLKAFLLQHFYKELDNKIDELQNEIASKYHINVEKSSK